jgi:hypothetical protein
LPGSYVGVVKLKAGDKSDEQETFVVESMLRRGFAGAGCMRTNGRAVQGQSGRQLE